jgi:hypothetical protein
LNVNNLEARIQAALLRNPARDDKHVAKAINVPVAAVRVIRAGGHLEEERMTPAEVDPGIPIGGFVSLDKVRARYDISAAIERELAALPRGRLVLEADLCQRAAGTDRNRFRRTVENNEARFGANRIKLRLDDSSDGRWYWGHADDVAEAARIRDL